MTHQVISRKLAAIFYADVAGYSRLTRQNEVVTHHRVMNILDHASETIKNGGGTVLRYAGDAILAEFQSVVAAMEAAVRIQNDLPERHSQSGGDQQIQIRIGLNLGEVMQDRGEIFGDDVNLAARLEAAALPGGVCISSTVYEQIRNKVDLVFADGGAAEFKNIDRPVHIYHWHPQAAMLQTATQPNTSSDKPSIAVMPFVNRSNDPEQEFLADGITEDIITELSRFSALLIIARNSSFSYKNQAIDPHQVSSELEVRYIIEGSIRRSGDRIRVTAKLLDTGSAHHVWSERYDRNISDIFDLQDEITRNIVASIAPQIEIAEIERGRSFRHSTLTSYEHSLKVQAILYDALQQGDYASLLRAIECAQSVLDRNARDTRALWVQAFAYIYQYLYRWGDDPDGALNTSAQLAERLLEIDSSNPNAYLALAMMHSFRGEFDSALEDYQRALDLNPNFALNLFLMSWGESCAGLTKQAREHAQLALRLSPRDLDIWLGEAYTALAQASLVEAKYDEAKRWGIRSAQAHSKGPICHAVVISSCGYLDDKECATRFYDALKSFAPDFIPGLMTGAITIYKQPDHNVLLLDGLRMTGLTDIRATRSINARTITLPDERSIAVLPFRNMSNDPEQDYFSDGIAEDIITMLSKIRGLRVVARSSTYTYKGTPVDVRQVGREQDVRYVLEGSVRKHASRVRVTAQLVDAMSGRQIWAERYDRQLDDIFAVQDELMREIVVALDVELTEGEQSRMWSSGTSNVEAWECVRLAVPIVFRSGSDKHLLQAKTLLDKALELDPEYPFAWVLLGWYHQNYADVAGGATDSASKRAAHASMLDCARRAIELDPSCADAYSVMAMYHLECREFDQAIDYAEKSISLAPSNSENLAEAAMVMVKAGKPRRGLELVKKAMDICPLYPPGYLRSLAAAYRFTGNAELSVEAYRESIKLESGFLGPHVNLTSALGELGRIDEAVEAAQEIVRLAPDFSVSEYVSGLSYRNPQDTERIEQGLHHAGLPE